MHDVFLGTDLNVEVLRIVGRDVEESVIVEVGLHAVVVQEEGVGQDAVMEFVDDLDVVAVDLLFVVQDDLEIVVFEFAIVVVVDVTEFVVKCVVVVDCVETFAVDVDSENTD